MHIVRLIIAILLALLPIALLLRDWKFHDRRTKRHHNITRTILIVWLVGSMPGAYFVYHDSTQIEELIEGKNQLLKKVESYQNDLTEKDRELRELQEKAKKAERGITEVYMFNGTVRKTNAGDISVHTGLKDVFNEMNRLKEQKDYSDLRDMCEVQAEKTPDWPTPYMFLGIALANIGDSEQAIEALQHFLEISPTESDDYSSYRIQVESIISKLRKR